MAIVIWPNQWWQCIKNPTKTNQFYYPTECTCNKYVYIEPDNASIHDIVCLVTVINWNYFTCQGLDSGHYPIPGHLEILWLFTTLRKFIELNWRLVKVDMPSDKLITAVFFMTKILNDRYDVTQGVPVKTRLAPKLYLTLIKYSK